MRQNADAMIVRKSQLTLAAFLLPMALDFNGPVGGGLVQFLTCGATLGAGLLLILGRSVRKPRTSLEGFSWVAVWGTLLASAMSASVNEVPFGNYIRAIMPWILFGLAFVVGAQRGAQANSGDVLRMMKLGAGISVVHKLLIGFFMTNLGVDDIRYQIISPALFTLEAITIYELIVLREANRISAVLLLTCLSIQVISVTRSALLGALLLLGSALWMASGGKRRFVHRFVKLCFVCVGSLSLAVFLSVLFSPRVLERWVERIFHYESTGVDLTTVTRLAEIAEQLNLWQRSAFTMLFGRGFGAEYGWSEEYWDILRVAYSLEDILTPQFYAGHNFFVHSLFAGGALFGPLVPVAAFWSVCAGIRAVRRVLASVSEPALRGEVWVKTLGTSTLVTVALFVTTIGGNPLGSRYGGLLHGLALGLLAGSFAVYHESRSGREKGRGNGYMGFSLLPHGGGSYSSSPAALGLSHELPRS